MSAKAMGRIEGDSAGVEAIDTVDPFAVLDRLPVGVVICSMAEGGTHPVAFINERARKILMPAGQGGAALEDLPILEYGEPLLGQFRRALRRKGPLGYDWPVEVAGEETHLHCTIVPLSDAAGGIPQVLCTISDRTAVKRAERNLLHHALHDSLTGLANRSLFQNRVEEAVRGCSEDDGGHCAVLLVNIDRFQLINETFGHAAGDAFLLEIAELLRGSVRDGDVLARLSGDEFAILITGLEDPSAAWRRADRIHAMLREPRLVGGTEAYSSVSIGIATTIEGHTHPESLIRDADVAMHKAKSSGRGRTELYRPESHATRGDQIALEAALRRAVENGELELHYQPIIDLADGRIVAFEALARWSRPEDGPVSPATFIPLAEDTGLIVPLGRWCMLEACRQLRCWRKVAPEAAGLQVNVNLSAVQFVQDDIAIAVAEALRKAEVEGDSLRLEITESALVGDPEGAAGTLHRIKALGPTLALDDFGTGYSSLNYLSSFPLDCIKIDRSFVTRIDRDTPATKIVHLITMLAETLDMSVVAEGIENDVQREVMRSLGCEYGQGFLFSRAVPADEAARLLVSGPLIVRQDGRRVD